MLLAVLAAVAGAAVQSATGFGFALILGPAVFAVLEPSAAVGALLVLGVALNLLVLADSGGAVRSRELVPLLAGAVPALAGGLLVLAALSKPVLQVAVGIAVIVAVAVRMVEPSRAEPAAGGVGGAVAVGALSGVLTTSTSVNGPPLVLWLERRGLAPGELRATLSAAFLVLNVAGAAALVAARGAGDLPELGELGPLFLATAAGYGAGALAFARIDPDRFGKAVLAVVTATGVASVAAGLAGL